MTNLAGGIEYREQLMYPKTRPNQLEGIWWLPDASTEARLVVTNTTGDPVDVQVKFEGQPGTRVESVHLEPWQMEVLDFGARRAAAAPSDGLVGGISIAYSGRPGGISARGLIANYALKYSAVVAFDHPVEARTSKYHAGGVRIGDVGGSRLRPVIVAHSRAGRAGQGCEPLIAEPSGVGHASRRPVSTPVAVPSRGLDDWDVCHAVRQWLRSFAGRPLCSSARGRPQHLTTRTSFAPS